MKIPRFLQTPDTERPKVTGFKGALVPSRGKTSTLMIQIEVAVLRSLRGNQSFQRPKKSSQKRLRGKTRPRISLKPQWLLLYNMHDEENDCNTFPPQELK